MDVRGAADVSLEPKALIGSLTDGKGRSKLLYDYSRRSHEWWNGEGPRRLRLLARSGSDTVRDCLSEYGRVQDVCSHADCRGGRGGAGPFILHAFVGESRPPVVCSVFYHRGHTGHAIWMDRQLPDNRRRTLGQIGSNRTRCFGAVELRQD